MSTRRSAVGAVAGLGPAAFARLGAEIAPMTVAEYDPLLREDIERRREWIRLAGIQPA